jgi:hypothetical protein
MSPHFSLSFFLQRSCYISALARPYQCIFPICKLLYKSGEDNKLSIPYANPDHTYPVSIAFAVAIGNFHVVRISILVDNSSVSQTIYCFFGMYYVETIFNDLYD